LVVGVQAGNCFSKLALKTKIVSRDEQF
jgi:hypothetical protein